MVHICMSIDIDQAIGKLRTLAAHKGAFLCQRSNETYEIGTRVFLYVDPSLRDLELFGIFRV